jgi:hypothetical protein
LIHSILLDFDQASIALVDISIGSTNYLYPLDPDTKCTGPFFLGSTAMKVGWVKFLVKGPNMAIKQHNRGLGLIASTRMEASIQGVTETIRGTTGLF